MEYFIPFVIMSAALNTKIMHKCENYFDYAELRGAHAFAGLKVLQSLEKALNPLRLAEATLKKLQMLFVVLTWALILTADWDGLFSTPQVSWCSRKHCPSPLGKCVDRPCQYRSPQATATFAECRIARLELLRILTHHTVYIAAKIDLIGNSPASRPINIDEHVLEERLHPVKHYAQQTLIEELFFEQ